MRAPMVLALALLAAAGPGCRQQDLRTVAVKVPAMHNAACARLIQDAFMRQPGIKSVRPDVDRREVAVTYDSMVIAIKNIEYTIAGAGFDANAIAADPQAAAALPPDCKPPPP